MVGLNEFKGVFPTPSDAGVVLVEPALGDSIQTGIF